MSETVSEFIDAKQRLKEIRERAENSDIHFPQIVKRDMKWLCDYAEELQNRLFNLAVKHSQLKYDEALKKLADS